MMHKCFYDEYVHCPTCYFSLSFFFLFSFLFVYCWFLIWDFNQTHCERWITDPSTCTVSVQTPAAIESSKKPVSSCTLYHDKGPEPWLRKTSTDAWLSTGVGEAIDGADGGPLDQGDIYSVVCYESGALEIFDVPNFNCVFTVDKFVSGRTHIVDTYMREALKDSETEINSSSEEGTGQGRKENIHSMKVVELAMQRWSGHHSRPFLFAILTDGTILCYQAYLFEGPENTSKSDDPVSTSRSLSVSNVSASRLRNLRFSRTPLDAYTREETPHGAPCQRITIFKNISGHQGFFLSGSRPCWCMVFRERLRVHPQVRNRVSDLSEFLLWPILSDSFISPLQWWFQFSVLIK